MKIVARKTRAAETAAPKAADLFALAKQALIDSTAFGITCRELKQKHPSDLDVIHYNRALAKAAAELGAKASWTMVRPPCDGTLQECRYRLKDQPAEEAQT